MAAELKGGNVDREKYWMIAGIVILVILCGTLMVSYVFGEYAGLSPLFALAVAIGVTAIVGYGLYRLSRYVYRLIDRLDDTAGSR